MSNKLTEQQVLRELNISGFSHITKDNFMKLVSMLPLMAPEVKKMALEQIPEEALIKSEFILFKKSVLWGHVRE